ncbi:MAG: Fic family protein, partial [Moorea sp. SIO3E2]|nr:Fic family protein [Moorena sp. SIO3E2]
KGELSRTEHEPIQFLAKRELVLNHAQFETVHPFLDGNGRTGRLLITFLLCEQNILKRPLLYISYYFKKYRSEYYDRLQAVRDSGNWEGWLKFFLRGVYEVAQEASATARNIVTMKEEHHQLLVNKMGKRTGNAIIVLDNLYFRPIITVEQVQKIIQLKYPNANKLVNDLCDVGILQEITGQKRNRVFAYAPYLELLNQGTNMSGVDILSARK